MECSHFWVARTDGYEEQCSPAICLVCGKYGCWCNFMSSIRDLPEWMQERRKQLFNDLGIEGNNHEIENTEAGRIPAKV